MTWTYENKTALVTGASSGIGEAFARDLARRGMDLVLVARSEDRLQAIARDIMADTGRKVAVIPADLSQADAVVSLGDSVAAEGLQIDLLVNNAGFGTYGAFEEQSADREHDEVMVNVSAVLGLCHAFVPGMIERRDGGVINVASVAAFQPTPYMSVYGATKSFVLSFSEGLWAELKPRGVRVLALCPGPVDTAFFTVIEQEKLKSAMENAGNMMTSEAVVAAALSGLEKGKSVVVPGARNRAMAASNRLVPRRLVASAAARVLKPRGGRSGSS